MLRWDGRCSALDNYTLGILTAPEVILVNQDPLGVAGDLVWKQGPAEVRPSQHHSTLTCLHAPGEHGLEGGVVQLHMTNST